jgi:hypothetical protein
MEKDKSSELPLGPVAPEWTRLAGSRSVRHIRPIRVDEDVIGRNGGGPSRWILHVQESVLSRVQRLRPLPTVEACAALLTIEDT